MSSRFPKVVQICLRLLPCPPVTSILPSILAPVMYFRRQFLYKMWPIQLAFLLFIVNKIIGTRLSRKSNNMTVFLFPFHIAVQQPSNLFGHASSYAIMNHLEHCLLCASSRCFQHQRDLCRISLLLNISLHLVPTLLICPAWETLLEAMLPLSELSGSPKLINHSTTIRWILQRQN